MTSTDCRKRSTRRQIDAIQQPKQIKTDESAGTLFEVLTVQLIDGRRQTKETSLVSRWQENRSTATRGEGLIGRAKS